MQHYHGDLTLTDQNFAQYRGLKSVSGDLIVSLNNRAFHTLERVGGALIEQGSNLRFPVLASINAQ